MGDLTGGYQSNSCESPSPVWYGKFSYSWDQMGSTPEVRLKDWLDPGNTGELVLPGTDGNDPIADFSADPPGTSPGGQIQFTDESMGNPENWTWTFEGGDPPTSTEQNPLVTYNNYGVFDVTLTISNTFGSDTEVKHDFIVVGDPPTADFEADLTTISVGDKVDFENLSSGDPTSQVWKFPGGSPFQSHKYDPPLIRYDEPGVYDVQLTVYNDYGSDVEVKHAYITVLGAPQPDFSADTSLVLAGGRVQFMDNTLGEVNTWSWTFQGGTPGTSTEQHPLVSYEIAGTYDVSLEVSGPNGTGDTTKQDFIVVIPPVDADFSCSNTAVIEGSSTSFTDESHGEGIQEWHWQFPGGVPSESNEQNVSQVFYPEAGTYDVSLSVVGPYNEDTELKTGYIRVGNPPEAAFEASALLVEEGQEVDFTDLSQENPTEWLWTFEGGTPGSSSEQNPTGIQWLESGTYDVSLQVSNVFGTDELEVTDYITVSGVGIEGFEETLNIFPNPSDGTFTVDLTGLNEEVESIAILSSTGKLVKMVTPEALQKKVAIAIAEVPVGIYTVKITTDVKVMTQQIQIVK